MKGFNLSKFKKMKEDKDFATLIHTDGHVLQIAKAPLSHLQRKQLQYMEVQHFDEGGTAQGEYLPGTQEVADLVQQGLDKDAEMNAASAETEAGNRLAASHQPVGTAAEESSDEEESPSPEVAAPVTPSPQESVPQPEQPQAAPPQSMMQTRNAGLEQQMQGQNELAQAQGAEGNKEAAVRDAVSKQLAALPSQQQIQQKFDLAGNQYIKAIQEGKVDPKKYWDDHSKVSAGIGVLLSAIGQGIGGGHVQGNGGLEMIHRGIDQEIDKQKNEQSKNMNLYRLNREALGNEVAANLATRNQLMLGVQNDIAKTAAESKSPIALANAKIANGQIKQMVDQNNFKLSLLQPSSDNHDPASLVQLLGVPEGRQQKVVDEINAAKNTVSNAPGILEAFDQAAKEVRPLTGGVNTSASAFNPWDKSAGQQALQVRLGPTFQDVEGTVRQAAMDNLDHNVTPKFGDSDEKIATKRASLLHYLTSKSSAGASKSFGIDLSRFPSTNTQGIAGGALNAPASMPTRNGVPYQRQVINGKAYLVPVRTGK